MGWGTRVATAMVVGGGMLAGAAEASAAKLTIEAVDDKVFSGATAAIEGRLTPDPGVAPDGHEVTLFEQEFPERRSQVAATTVTDTAGRYSFDRLRTDANTRFRVAISDEDVSARSRRVDVFAFPMFEIDVRVRRDRAISTMHIRYSKKLRSVPTFRTFFYFAKSGSEFAVRKATTRARRKGDGVQVARDAVQLPPSDKPYRFTISGCIQVADVMFGLFDPDGPSKCPQRLRLRGGRQPAAFSSLSAKPFIP